MIVLPKQEQITKHNCIQGWSAVAEWGGVRMSTILEMCRPLPQARYVVFHAFPQAEYAPLTYYEILTLDEVLDPQTILAYEMNWNPLPIPHGAPCRLRIETKTGYKMVKYLRAIEVVDRRLEHLLEVGDAGVVDEQVDVAPAAFEIGPERARLASEWHRSRTASQSCSLCHSIAVGTVTWLIPRGRLTLQFSCE